MLGMGSYVLRSRNCSYCKMSMWSMDRYGEYWYCWDCLSGAYFHQPQEPLSPRSRTAQKTQAKRRAQMRGE